MSRLLEVFRSFLIDTDVQHVTLEYSQTVRESTSERRLVTYREMSKAEALTNYDNNPYCKVLKVRVALYFSSFPAYRFKSRGARKVLGYRSQSVLFTMKGLSGGRTVRRRPSSTRANFARSHRFSRILSVTCGKP